jgi:hypothetical protein
MSNARSDLAPGHNRPFTIYVNTREMVVSDHRLSYEQVVKLAFPDDAADPNRRYTVAYANQHGHDGTLVAGQDVEVKEGMVFNVVRSNRS